MSQPCIFLISNLLILFLLKFKFGEFKYLNSGDQTFLLKFIEHRKIRNCIFVENQVKSWTDFSNFKIFSAKKIFSSLKTEENLFNYILEVRPKFENPKTLIICKNEDLEALKRFLFSLKEDKKLNIVSTFTWVILMNKSQDYLNFYVPYDCEFFILNSSDPLKMNKIIKVFNLGNHLQSVDYGSWEQNFGYNFSTALRYPGGTNMNRTLFLGFAQQCAKGTKLHKLHCIRETFFKDFIKSMNFAFEEVTYKKKFSASEIGSLMETIYIRDGNYKFKKFVKYLQKSKLILIIKHPEGEKTSDFYLRPFKEDVWIALFLTVTAGGLFCFFLWNVENIFLRNAKKFQILSTFLTPYVSLCNQGDECDENIPLRISFFFFRFLAIFVVPAYCADLTAFLAIKIEKIPFKSIEELVDNGDFKLLLNNQHFAYTYYKERNDTIGERLRAGIIEHYTNSSVAIERICGQEKLAINVMTDVYFADFNCQLFRIPRPVANIFPVLYMGYENHYHQLINHVFLQARESGLVQNILKILSSSTEKYFNQGQQKDFQTIGMSQLIQIFSFLGVGLFAGMGFLVIEIGIYYSFKMKIVWKKFVKKFFRK